MPYLGWMQAAWREHQATLEAPPRQREDDVLDEALELSDSILDEAVCLIANSCIALVHGHPVLGRGGISPNPSASRGSPVRSDQRAGGPARGASRAGGADSPALVRARPRCSARAEGFLYTLSALTSHL